MKYEDLLTYRHTESSKLYKSNDVLIDQKSQFKSQYEAANKQNEHLTSELGSAQAARQHLEEDAQKIRMEMRTQMDALRNNMHKLLLKGGDQALVLKDQNAEIMIKQDEMLEEINQLKSSKARLGKEVTFLHLEQKQRVKSEKEYMRQITALKLAMAEVSEERRTVQTELSKIATPYKMLKENNLKLSRKLSEAIKEHCAEREEDRETLQDLAEEKRVVVASMEQQIWKLTLQMDGLAAETAVDSRLLEKHEKSSQEEIERMQSRLSEQEESLDHFRSAYFDEKQDTQRKIESLTAENSRLRSELLKANETLASLDSFVEAEHENYRVAQKEQRSILLKVDAEAEELGIYDANLLSIDIDIDINEKEEDIHNTAERRGIVKDTEELGNRYNEMLQLSQTIDKQRNYLESEFPTLPEGLKKYDFSEYDNEESGQFKAIRAGLLLVRGAIEYGTSEARLVQEYVVGQNKKLAHELTGTRSALEISLEHSKAAVISKEGLEKSHKLHSQREYDDENYIAELEAHIFELRERLAGLSSEHEQDKEHKKGVETANSVWELKCGRLESDLNRITGENDNLKAEGRNLLKTKDDLLDELYCAKADLDLKDQECAVTKSERDELVKSFVRYDTTDGRMNSVSSMVEESKD